MWGGGNPVRCDPVLKGPIDLNGRVTLILSRGGALSANKGRQTKGEDSVEGSRGVVQSPAPWSLQLGTQLENFVALQRLELKS